MKNAFIAVFLVVFLCLTLTGKAQLRSPTVTWSVQVEGAEKHYQYKLFNDALDFNGNPPLISAFRIAMSDKGARLITRHQELSGWTYDLRIVSGYATAYWFSSSRLFPGETAVFDLYTAANVPTAYTWNDPTNTNWEWGSATGQGIGGFVLPTPVPEPSSVLVMLNGLLGMAGLARRKRG